MTDRLTKIYTRRGDDGTTGLADGARVNKNTLIIEVIGDIDELNCAIGVVLTQKMRNDIRECLVEIQHKLFNLGAQLNLPQGKYITEQDVQYLEKKIDEYNKNLPPLKEFILPSGSLSVATCHMARAICRRAERHMVALYREQQSNVIAIKYLNRLSDFLFVACRVLASAYNQNEVYWRMNDV